MSAEKKFAITIDLDEVLTLSQLWPDGDAPEDPTEQDVCDLIEEYGGPEGILRDWHLGEYLRLHVREVKP